MLSTYRYAGWLGKQASPFLQAMPTQPEARRSSRCGRPDQPSPIQIAGAGWRQRLQTLAAGPDSAALRWRTVRHGGVSVTAAGTLTKIRACGWFDARQVQFVVY